MRRMLLGILAAAVAAGAPAKANTVTDSVPAYPETWYLENYKGVQDGSLDILSASASFDGTNFTLSATTNGTIGLPGSLYVFGINRGWGTARLTFGDPGFGAGILWDALAILFPDGTGRVVTFADQPPPVLPVVTNLPGAVTVNGSTITGTFAASLLPSTHFEPEAYTFTLWSRLRANANMDGSNNEIADFAPDASGFTAGAPEPGSWMLMIAGFGVVGTALRRRPRPHLAF